MGSDLRAMRMVSGLTKNLWKLGKKCGNAQRESIHCHGGCLWFEGIRGDCSLWVRRWGGL